MVYKATQDVVRRVMPLLERLASRTVDRARLLQYLSAQAGVAWGVLEVAHEEEDAEGRTFVFRDLDSGAEHRLRYPEVLSTALEPLVVAEYQRLALARPLSKMDVRLFEALFGESHCARCRWRGPEHAQVHAECHFAGHPVNFEE